MRIFYMISYCKIRETISNTIKKISRSTYFQKQFENVKKTLLKLLSLKFIFH